MDYPDDAFLTTMSGKRVAVTTNVGRLLHGVLLKFSDKHLLVGLGPVKEPRLVDRTCVTKVYPLNDDKNDGQRPGMVMSGSLAL